MGYRGCGCAGFGNGPTDPPYGPPPTGAVFTCKDGTQTPNPTTCPEWGQQSSSAGMPDLTRWAFYGAAALAGIGIGMSLAGR